MTPSAYKKGGPGIQIRYAISPSPRGPALIARTGRGVCAVLFGRYGRALVAQLRREFPRATLKRESTVKSKSVARFAGNEDPLLRKLSMSLRKRVFQAKLLSAPR